MVINTSSESAGAQRPRQEPWLLYSTETHHERPRVLTSETLSIPQIPLLHLALQSHTHLPTVPASRPKNSNSQHSKREKNYNSQKVLRSGGLQ